MKEEKLRTKTLLLYEHIDEMPIDLYNSCNEYSLSDAQIGSDMDSVKKHFEKFDIFINRKDLDGLAGERKNLHRNLFNVLNHNNYRGLNYACHIYSVNGERVFDYSAEGLKRLLTELSKDGLTMGHISRHLGEVKKKSFWSFAFHFRNGLILKTRLSPGKTLKIA